MVSDPERDVLHRQLDTSAETPSAQIAEVVAEVEGRDPADLPIVYHCVDDVLEAVFSDPPTQEAHVEVAFDYAGYRVTVTQDGSATFFERQ